MLRHVAIALTALLLLCGHARAQDKGKPDPKKPVPPEVLEILKLTPEEFLQKFDKNMDGFLQRDELPVLVAKYFDKADLNGDGKLDRKETQVVLSFVRAQFNPDPVQANLAAVEKLVEKLLAEMDKDMDGKISKAEARGKIADGFALLDKNMDGFLDRAELRAMAQQVLGTPKFGGPGPGGGPPDFDALDKNADGRLTREELKGTPFFEVFDEIDTNRDGRIDQREFEAYLKKKSGKDS